MAFFITNTQSVRENNVIISIVGSEGLGFSLSKKINGARKF